MSATTTTQAAFDPVALLYDKQPNPMLGLEERYVYGLLPCIRGLDVLDVGCGTGRWLRRLADREARSLTGVDPSEGMLAIARTKLGGAVRLFQASAETLPLLDASADVILCSFVLSYCEHLDAVVHELARVARPHATILVSDLDPTTEEKFGWKRTFASESGTVAMATVRHQRQALESAFRRAGFEAVARLELPFESEEWNVIENSGKPMAVQEGREAPAIYISQFVASRHEPQNSVSFTRARVAFGPSAASRVEIATADRKTAWIGVAGSPSASIDLGGCLVLPGLINAHDHLEFGLYPNLGRGPYQNCVQWAHDIHSRDREAIELHEHVPKDVRLYFGGLRNLLSGVTTVCHHNPYAPVFRNDDFPVRVIENFDWAHSLPFDRQGVQSRSRPDADLPFVFHAAEGLDEASGAEIAELDAMGALNERTVLVHALGCSESDIALINRRRAAVVACPSSNAFLYGTTLRPERVLCLEKVVLGTDSPLTARGDLLEEIRFAGNALQSSASALYSMCTDTSADILRLRGGEGKVVPGGVADLLVVRDRGSSPADSLFALTLEDIELVLVGGQVRLASESGMQRLPAGWREHLSPLQVEQKQVWVHAPLQWMFEAARAVLGDVLKISGKRVDYVG